MLNRSFKPTKCKTSLKLASSRIKLLKNKKEVQVKQMKRELAQLLESGQDQTARIRVEHVVREEKTMAAFELLEIYCELIVARLPIIESQKNCPIDLKEAITSVIFASPRCADLPELQDVRKHFTAKYGKEFINAAIELRPECGVSRMLVEKLSAKAPDGQTKIKILTAIAEEHDIKWDPKSFGEKELKPPDDLLNGPNTFEKASKMRTEPPIIQPPPSEVQAPSSLAQMNNASVNFEHNARSSASSDNFASTDVGGTQTTVQGTSHPGVRPSGTGSDRMEVRHSYYGDRQNWNMEFKDATAAAQAAAESAERASMAARAAAELSSRGKISRQYSTESHKSNIYSSRDEGLTENAASKLPTQQLAKNSEHNLFQDRNPQKQTVQVDSPERDNLDEAAESVYRDFHGSSKRSSRSASVDEGAPMNDMRKADRYQRKSSFEEEAVKTEKSPVFPEMSTKKQSIGSEVEFASGQQSDNFSYFGEERIAKKASSVSSRSHSRNHSDGYDVSPSSHQKFGSDVGENPFFGIDKGNTHSDAVHTSYYNDAPVVFDDPVSDDDLRFDTLPKYDRQESLYSASPPKELPSYISANTDTWSPRQNISGSDDQFSSVTHVSAERYFPPVFDESLTKSSHPSQQEDFLPVAFDESEGPSSESEDELHQSRLGGKTDHGSQPNKESNLFSSPYDIDTKSHGLTGSFLSEKDDLGSNRKQELHYSSDEDELVEVSSKINLGTEFSTQSHRKFGFDEVPTRQSSSKLTKPQINSDEKPSEPFYSHVEERKSWLSPQTSRLSLAHEAKDTPALSDTMRDDESFEQLSLESGKELNFETLTGGLRNKGYRRRPYNNSPSGDASLSRKAGEISVTPIEHPSASPAVKSYLNPGVSTNVKNKSSFRTPTAEDDSDTDDSDEEDPPQNSRSEREQHGPKASKDVYAKSRLRAPGTFFDDNDPEEDLPKQAFTSSVRAGSGLSRRTKATPSSGTSSYSKMPLSSKIHHEPQSQTDIDAKNEYSRSSYRSATPPEPRSQTDADAKRMSSSSYNRSETPPEPHSQTDADAKNVPSRSSYRAVTPPEPRSQTDADAKRMSSRSYNRSETPPEPQSQTDADAKNVPSRSSYHSATPPEPRSQTDADAKRMSSRSYNRSKTPPEPQSQTDADAKNVPSRSSYRSKTPPKPWSQTDADAQRMPRSSYPSETPPKPHPQTTSSNHWENSPELNTDKQGTSQPKSESNSSLRKENLKSSAVEQPSSPLKTVTSAASTESLKTSTSSGEAPSREGSLKKASHVHPKLPDYDTIAAHLQSLRANRQ